MIRLPQDACHELGALIDHLLTTVQLKQPLLAAKVACHRAKVIGRGRLQPKDGAHLVRNQAGTAHTAHVNEPRSVRIEPTDALRKTDREPRLAHPPGPSRVRRRVVPNAPRADDRSVLRATNDEYSGGNAPSRIPSRALILLPPPNLGDVLLILSVPIP